MTKPEQTRRRFLQTIGTGMAASLIGVEVSCGQAQPPTGKKQRRFEIRNPRFEMRSKRQFELGLASYTLRNFKLDETLGKVGITYADGKIYALNHRGTLSLLDVTPEGFKVISRFDLKKRPTNSYLAHPVVLDGRLYIRCDQDLYAYDVRAN